tara:strand:+ start:1217 stop:1798 length:582 start_codon:yes stop_codon:yes gene_type:complete
LYERNKRELKIPLSAEPGELSADEDIIAIRRLSYEFTYNIGVEQDMAEVESVTTMDFGDYENEKENIFRVVEDGEYELQLKTWEHVIFQKSQKDALNFRFETVNCEDPDNDGVSIFHRVGWNTPFLKMALLALAGSNIKGASIDLEEIRDGKSEFMDSLVGEVVEASVKIDTYKPEDSDEEVKNNKIVKFQLA